MKALKITNHTSKIVSSENILGIPGTFIIPESNKIFAGTTYGVDGAMVGSLPYCEGNDSGCYLRSYSQDVNSLKAFNYDDINSKKSNIKNGYTLITGITGNQTLCSAGSNDCYIDGSSFTAVESSNLIATNIKHDVTLGGVTGSYAGAYSNCSSSSHTGCVAISEYPSSTIRFN